MIRMPKLDELTLQTISLHDAPLMIMRFLLSVISSVMTIVVIETTITHDDVFMGLVGIFCIFLLGICIITAINYGVISFCMLLIVLKYPVSARIPMSSMNKLKDLNKIDFYCDAEDYLLSWHDVRVRFRNRNDQLRAKLMQ